MTTWIVILIGVAVVVAVAGVALVVVRGARARRRPEPGIGAVLPSGAILNPSSVGTAPSAPPAAAPRMPAAPPAAERTAPDPAARISSSAAIGDPAGNVAVPDDVLRLVADGRRDEAVAALAAATGRDREWAQRAVDGLARADVQGFLGAPGAGTTPSSTRTTSATVSWSVSSGAGTQSGSSSSPRSIRAGLPDEILDLVRSGRTDEAADRLRTEVGMDAAGARTVVDTLGKLDLNGLSGFDLLRAFRGRGSGLFGGK